MSSEDYEVQREGLADAPVPYVTDNPHTPVPYGLTPQGEAAAGEPDTWTSPSISAAFRESIALNGPERSGGPAVVEVSRNASPVTVLWFGTNAEPEPGS